MTGRTEMERERERESEREREREREREGKKERNRKREIATNKKVRRKLALFITYKCTVFEKTLEIEDSWYKLDKKKLKRRERMHIKV